MIAEQVLKGGVPAVRQAVDRMNEQARAEGRAEVKPDALVTVAEKLLPALRAAEWRDRAEAAVADLTELDLRDLRSVVVAADGAAKDDESRELAATLREGLNQRVEQEQSAWLAELSETLTEGRVVRALRLSSRPPKAGAPLPAELSARLAEAASGALTADTLPDRWATVLDALSFSPVRLTVAPASKPDAPSDELVGVITRIAARVPKVAEAFGIEAPADAPRRRGGRGGAKGGARSGTRPPRPPKPPKPPVEPPASGSTEAPAAEDPATTDTAAGDAAVAAAAEAPQKEAPVQEPSAEPTLPAEASEPGEAPDPNGSAEPGGAATSPDAPPDPAPAADSDS